MPQVVEHSIPQLKMLVSAITRVEANKSLLGLNIALAGARGSDRGINDLRRDLKRSAKAK